MTLVVAEIRDRQVWMAADTAITDPAVAMRGRRRYFPKIEAVGDTGLVGFAGDDAHNASRIARAVAALPAGEAVLGALRTAQETHQHADFVHAFVDEQGTPRLFRVAEGRAEESGTFHLGSQDAFAAFQRLRHQTAIEHAPDALHMLLIGSKRGRSLPPGLDVALKAMFDLFASRTERDVGGWPVAYTLGPEGVEMCPYAYGVTDPILGRLPPGMLIPHGTAPGGGFGLSLTELREGDGMVVYWLQRPGGRVFVRAAEGYDEHDFDGPPLAFKESVRTKLGREVDLFFGDGSSASVRGLRYMRDEQGRRRVAVAECSDGSLSFAWVQNTDAPFRAGGVAITRGREEHLDEADEDRPMQLMTALADDRTTVTLEMRRRGEALGHMFLDAAAVDRTIAALATLRAAMVPAVAAEIAPGEPLLTAVDPAWRTRPSSHPLLPGPLLNLRHPGLGWTSFLLPYPEAASLGHWLIQHVIEVGQAFASMAPEQGTSSAEETHARPTQTGPDASDVSQE